MALSIEELASRAGTAPDAVRRLAELGLLAPEPRQGPFSESIVPRVRLALQLESSGISLEDVGRAVEEGRLSLAFVDRLFGRPVTMLGVSARELECELSLSPEFVDDVRIALGVTAAADEPIRGDDAEVLRLLERFVRQGLDERVAEEVTIRYFFLIADAVQRIAQGGREMWTSGVAVPMSGRGLTIPEYLEAIAAPGPGSQMLTERMLVLLFHRFVETEIVQATVEHLETALDQAGVRRRPEEAPAAIAFLDLSGYTRMTEEAGDETAADQVRRLADLVRRTSIQLGGRLVKMLGDGAMLHFADPSAAVRWGLELVGRQRPRGCRLRASA